MLDAHCAQGAHAAVAALRAGELGQLCLGEEHQAGRDLEEAIGRERRSFHHPEKICSIHAILHDHARRSRDAKRPHASSARWGLRLARSFTAAFGTVVVPRAVEGNALEDAGSAAWDGSRKARPYMRIECPPL